MPLVLVVEDHADTLDLVAQILTRFNYQVRTAASAAQAVQSILADRPAAILLDIKLPDASGTAGLDALQSVMPAVPIVMLTGNTDAVVARETLKRGAPLSASRVC